jgi:hypothetical protein
MHWYSCSVFNLSCATVRIDVRHHCSHRTQKINQLIFPRRSLSLSRSRVDGSLDSVLKRNLFHRNRPGTFDRAGRAKVRARRRRHNASHHRARGASIRIRAHTWASRRRRRRTTSTRGGRGTRMWTRTRGRTRARGRRRVGRRRVGRRTTMRR